MFEYIDYLTINKTAEHIVQADSRNF
jgi:hypothetical protein